MLITGASTGIGAATAKAAHEAGYNVALGARSLEKLRARQEELGGEERVLVAKCDVTDPEEMASFMLAAKERFGSVDVLFANAGVGGEPGGFSEAPISSWKRILDTNVLGLAITIQKALPLLRESRGHVVITGSVAGRRVFPGSMYSVSKWAANALAYNLREELKGSGIRVTLLEPGIVETPFFDAPQPNALRPENIAASVMYAVSAPPGVDVHDLLILPTPPLDQD